MTALLLAVIPIVLTALFAGQVAVTRTGRLRKDVLANLDLLDRLPAEHPNRAALEAKNGELVGVLACRQQRRYGPFTPAGVSFGVCTGVAIVALVFAGFSALLAARGYPLDPGLGPADHRGPVGRGSGLLGHGGRLRRGRGHGRPAATPRASDTGAAAGRGRLGPFRESVMLVSMLC